MNGMSFVAGATGVLLAAYVVLITVGIAGAVCSIIGLVRGVSSRNATAVALGGIGFGCAVFGVFVFRIVLWIAGLACGAMACQLSTQPRVPSFEEYKQQKAMLEDPEYAEYMRNVAAQASMQKHGGKAKQPMSGGKVGAIVLIVFAVLAVCAFAFGSAANNGTFDHLGGAPAVEQEGGAHTLEDLGDGTILFLPEHQ
nr:hypothetical protein [Bifidobacterium catenulatum]